MRALRSQCFSPQMNNRHPWQLKKIKILGAVLELPAKQHCQSSPFTSKFGQIGQIGTAGSSKTAPQDFDFFNCPGCWIFILCEIHCYIYPPKSWHNKTFLGSVSVPGNGFWKDFEKAFFLVTLASSLFLTHSFTNSICASKFLGSCQEQTSATTFTSWRDRVAPAASEEWAEANKCR